MREKHQGSDQGFSLAVVPRLILLALVALTLQGCGKAKPDSTAFTDSVTGVSVRYTLRHGDSFSDEFIRDFRISFAHGTTDFPLSYDSGGYVLMSIYRMSDGTLVFFDREDYVVVDSIREVVRKVERIDQASEAEFLGCFDWFGEDHSLQFVPPSRRGDRYGLEKR